LSTSRIADGAALRPHLWLAWSAPAGLARRPIPHRRPAARRSIAVGWLVPPSFQAGPGSAHRGATVARPGGLAVAQRSDIVDLSAAVDVINWFGDQR
jgi:hypothetical protein